RRARQSRGPACQCTGREPLPPPGATPPRVPPPVTIPPAPLADAPAIADTSNYAPVDTTAHFDLVERSVAAQREWLAARAGAFAAIVAVDDASRRVVGFASLSPYRERPAYATTVEDSIYVHRDHTGHGIGRALLEHLLDVARSSGFHTVIARIEAGSTASRALHAAVGFELVGIERDIGRKFQRWLSVAVMQKML